MSERLALEQFLAEGRQALSEIAKLSPDSFGKPRICFHFRCPEDDKADRWGEDAECVLKSTPLFQALPFKVDVDDVGGCVGIEAWEKVWPNLAWLDDRLPRMFEIAQLSQMEFIGWSFEPKDGPILTAGVNVMSADTVEGRASLDGLIEFTKATER